jgi:excisionase family DNA binding protein
MRLKTVKEVAGELGISSRLLYSEIEKGRLPHYLVGSRLLLDPKEILRIARQRAEDWRRFVKVQRAARLWTPERTGRRLKGGREGPKTHPGGQ